MFADVSGLIFIVLVVVVLLLLMLLCCRCIFHVLIVTSRFLSHLCILTEIAWHRLLMTTARSSTNITVIIICKN